MWVNGIVISIYTHPFITALLMCHTWIFVAESSAQVLVAVFIGVIVHNVIGRFLYKPVPHKAYYATVKVSLYMSRIHRIHLCGRCPEKLTSRICCVWGWYGWRAWARGQWGEWWERRFGSGGQRLLRKQRRGLGAQLRAWGAWYRCEWFSCLCVQKVYGIRYAE